MANAASRRTYEKPLSFILVKPAGPDCNMNCSYCFYHKTGSRFSSGEHRMDDQTLHELIRQAMAQSGRSISFGWQGGEPTLMGIDFYRKAVSLQQSLGGKKLIQNSIQTNGLLITRQWAEFLKEQNFLVGLSIDGPSHIHDTYRKNSGGSPTFTQVKQAADILFETGTEVNALSVVTSYSVNYPREIYQCLRDMGFTYMQFIPCIETDPGNPGKPSGFSVPPEELGSFLCTLFDLWLDDFHDGKPTTSIRNFESLLFAYAGQMCPDCTFQRTCGNYVVVEHNGEVYSCDFFVEDAWRLGNIETSSLIEMLNSKRQQLFGNMKSKVQKKCISCPWLWICRGGCTKDRLRCPDDKRISRFCSAYKKFFAYSDNRMRNLVNNYRRT